MNLKKKLLATTLAAGVFATIAVPQTFATESTLYYLLPEKTVSPQLHITAPALQEATGV